MVASESEMKLGPAERAVVLGIRLFRFVGGLLLLFFIVDTFFSIMDLRLRDPASELRFASQMSDRIPLALLGLALLFCHPRFLRTKPEAVVLRFLAATPLLLAVLYILLVPLTTLAAANYFRYTTYGLDQMIEEQVKKMRTVRDATLKLSPDQQQTMVDRYNQSNPQKNQVDLTGFLKTLNDEVKASEAQFEQQRRKTIEAQQKNLYASQGVLLLKLVAGVIAFFYLWSLTRWARPIGQLELGSELGVGRHHDR